MAVARQSKAGSICVCTPSDWGIATSGLDGDMGSVCFAPVFVLSCKGSSQTQTALTTVHNILSCTSILTGYKPIGLTRESRTKRKGNMPSGPTDLT
jgi:hypothetical protein